MEQIRVIGLSKSFGVRQVFNKVSFEIKHGERVGLVGPNGAGKSTLMKCLLGIEEYDEGQVVKDSATTIGYLQQDINLGDDSLAIEIQKAFADVQYWEGQLQDVSAKLETNPHDESLLKQLARIQDRLDWLGGYDYEAQSRRIAYGLGFSDEDLTKSVSEFSGGQKTRINLAKALVRRPDFLFLDEPTNHLDMDMLEWLENYLSSYGGGILIISHDRYFLDRVTTRIVELEHHKATSYRGNYSRYVEQREAQHKAQQNAYEKQQEYIRKTEEYIDKYRAGIKSKMARGRQSQLNRLERLDAPEQTQTLKFRFPKAEFSADKVLTVEELFLSYGERDIVEDVSFMIRRGEAVALIGPNGAGKSTLLKAITGELTPEAGFIDIGSRVSVGYFSQEHEELHSAWTPIDEIMSHFNYSEEKARNVLGMFLFQGDDVFKEIRDLSGGERARLSLLILFLQGNNFLILDEPTNHLDIPTREVVEEALMNFTGTLLVVSHDRYFLDKVAKRTLVLEPEGVEEYLGNYSYYKAKLKEQQDLAALAAEQSGQNKERSSSNKRSSNNADTNSVDSLGSNEGKNTGSNGGTEDSGDKKLNSYMQAKKLEETETEIARLEATLKMYEVQIQNPALQEDAEAMAETAAQMEVVTNKLAELYEIWEQLAQ
ncbi:MAG: ABC-F family ATP-binding cassette domain-containing protein [Veillonella sp.]|uniref:ABC-F family ATP-binding cassette domain-containing protein n=1 Tax=Veillonella sp. TaxID=1926307 RepID=UPI0025E4B0AD|nr:ABC-F family ATP-binding cassette domain-containing protein [Veillonella sp.]MBE6079976.1 ABC-F family ATP-binding cassette domain-containing protein [Veillonella sp.]